LRSKGLPVRALVRREDDRSKALSNFGAEIVVGDMTNLPDLHKAINGCSRIYFGIGVSDSYLEVALNTIAVAKHYNVEVFVNISQMTVSQMDINKSTESRQQKFHWLVEQALNWSGLPVVHLRSTIFLENPFFTQFAKSDEIRLPFGQGRTSPIASIDVARVAVEILCFPQKHIGKVYELTGPKSQDMYAIAKEFSKARHREIRYVDIPQEEFEKTYLKTANFPAHVENHLSTIAKLHHENRFDRFSNDVEKVTGEKPISIEYWVSKQNVLTK